MGTGNLSKHKQPPFERSRLYNIHGIQYIHEKKPPSKQAKSQATQNGVQGKLIREASSVNGFGDIQWLNAEFPFENIVMSGGGSKGYAYIGALKALEDAGLPPERVKKYAGSSVGAIMAGLLAVGCTAQDVADMFHCDIEWLFLDQKCACCCCLPKLCNRYGVHPAKRFHKIYGEHIAKKVGNPDITFGELYQKYGRELCIVVTNLSKMCSEYCHAKTTPDLPIRTAVRMSMSFPMVYQAVKANINGQEALYTDGGTLDQYPVHCFDGPDLELNDNSEKGNSSPSTDSSSINEKTLGLYVVSEGAIDYKIWKALFGQDIPYKPSYLPDTKLARQRLEEEFQRRSRKSKDLTMKEFLAELKAERANHEEPMFHYETCDKSSVDIRSFKEYFITTIETLLISQRRLHIKPNDVKRTVAINCGYIGTNDYVLEPGDREFMIRQGYECMRRFLQEYIAKHRTPTSGYHNPWDSIQEGDPRSVEEIEAEIISHNSCQSDTVCLSTDPCANHRPADSQSSDNPSETGVEGNVSQSDNDEVDHRVVAKRPNSLALTNHENDTKLHAHCNGISSFPPISRSNHELKMSWFNANSTPTPTSYNIAMRRSASDIETVV